MDARHPNWKVQEKTIVAAKSVRDVLMENEGNWTLGKRLLFTGTFEVSPFESLPSQTTSAT